jgi:polysaccharide pyruvyl transferase WcaK-like protein
VGLLTPYTGGNLGDGAIQDALIAQIRSRFPGSLIRAFTLDPEKTEKLHQVPCFPLTSRPEGLAKKLPLPRFVRFLIQEAAHTRKAFGLTRQMDILIASGGGQLDDYWGGPWGHPYALFKWSLIAKLRGAKFLMLSLGTCSLDSRLSRLFIRQALKRASYRSYRDETSKKLLETVPFTKDDPVFPDLAFSYPKERIPKPATLTAQGDSDGATTFTAQGDGKLEAIIPVQGDGGGAQSFTAQGDGKLEAIIPVPRTGIIAVSPIAYLSRFYWPERNDDFFRRYLDTLVAFVSWLLDTGRRVLFFATASADRAVVDEVMAALTAHPCAETDRMGRLAESTAAGLLARLPPVDYVVASRLHGVLLSHLAGKPVLAISYDRKVDTYMTDMGQARYCLNIHGLDLDTLKESFSSLQAEARSLREAITVKTDRYRSRLDAQYDHVLWKRI